MYEFNERILHREKCDKISGFFNECVSMGYTMSDAWDLMLTSKQGSGILNNDYYYCIHVEGRDSATFADEELGYKYKKGEPGNPEKYYLDLFAEFIEYANKEYNIEYVHLFDKCSASEFYDKCHIGLGNYDHKLVEAYLL